MGMDLPPIQDNPSLGGQLLRIERGARVLGPDGQLGTLRQMIVSQDTGDLRRLVVRSEAGMDIELPASSIVSASGDEIRLTIGLRDLADHPELARPFAAERYEHGGTEDSLEAPLVTSSASTLLTEEQIAAMRDATPGPGNDLLDLAPLAAIGLLVGGGVGALAYLLTLRRRQRAALAVPTTARVSMALRGGAQRGREQLRQLASANTDTLRNASQKATASMSDLLVRASTVTAALAASAQALWDSRPRLSLPSRVAPAIPDTTAIAERVRQPARQVRKAVARQRRGARRLARRARWLRNGLIVGGVLGVLYAPEPGSESRRRIGRALRDIPGLRLLLEPVPPAPSAPRPDLDDARLGASDIPATPTSRQARIDQSAEPMDMPPMDLPPMVH